MTILTFSASAVAAQIDHARRCRSFLPNWNGPVDAPALILIVGNGVHLRSNGIDAVVPENSKQLSCREARSSEARGSASGRSSFWNCGPTTRIVTTEDADPSFAFADGINPYRNVDWMERRQAAFRDLTGQFYTGFLEDVQMLIDRGCGTIRLATDGHTVRVFANRASDYMIGGTYEVPSGLGGRFRVILKDACQTFAIVQNCGNTVFREYRDDSATPMAREREAWQGIGVSTGFPKCTGEDFDAMQPYRVPLDALFEITDRRAA